MTEDEKFIEVFNDIRLHPERYELEHTPSGGKMLVGYNVLVSSSPSDKLAMSLRGVPGSQSIEIPHKHRNLVDECFATVRAYGESVTKSLPSFLKR